MYISSWGCPCKKLGVSCYEDPGTIHMPVLRLAREVLHEKLISHCLSPRHKQDKVSSMTAVHEIGRLQDSVR